ncbi:DNA repair [Hyphodiscus hymeniophilus]|uniref:DNA repair n=1 Tax=Hyphodiscus hymeniophilus TaxID=353542 RepID=A0A9P6SKB9_9HELO|nr:DNA repair [Hyphodiscus hymeniophilus]
MGVTGLWSIVAETARPTPLPTLNRKRLAVDASIWIYQFLKAVRDKEGNALRNSHVVGFFRRICKLLYFGIKPVFVFDGGAPVLKRQTVLGRKKRREGRRDDAVRTAGRLLAVQMKKRGEEEEERRKQDRERAREGRAVGVQDEEVPDERELVYVGELGMSAQERTATRKFHKKDAYHLPELTNGIEGMGKPDDPRIMSTAELEEYARQFNSGEDVNLYDFSKIDFNGDFFMSLPAGDRYNILNAARLRSRLRMGLSKEQLEDMFPDRMAFSRFQIERVQERNHLTQKLMNLNGMNDDLPGVGGGRIAGQSGREYVLVKNEGVEGGWALGVVSTDKTVGEREKPIDVDALHQKIKEIREESESEDEFEDVPIEGLNRLPKPQPDTQNLTYEDYQAQEVARQRQQIHAPRNGTTTRIGESSREARGLSLEPGLFVDNGLERGNEYRLDEEEEDLNVALAMSSRNDRAPSEVDEEEHLSRAIALSLQKNHHQESESEDDADFEDVVMPDYEQRAVADPKPITNTSGRMVAHIVNNRATAAVPKPRATSLSSDSDMDFQSALAKARKQKAPEKKRQPAPVASNLKNPFDGPLPFEKLDFRTSIFSKKSTAPKEDAENGEVADEGDLEGGFEKESQEVSKPLPPWLVGNEDVRDQMQEQQRRDRELNAEDRERRLEEERAWRKEHAPIEVDSSDNDSVVEILDAPPPPKTSTDTMGDVADDLRAEPPISEIPNDRQPSVEIVPSPKEAELPRPESEEMADWSESDYGDVTTKPANVVDSTAKKVVSHPVSRSPSMDFEEIEIPAQTVERDSPAKSPSPRFEDVSMEADDLTPEVNGIQNMSVLPDVSNSHNQADFANEDDFDDFSDPDDEELLAQLAIEAEEHARFASTLNNKSQKENHDTYDRELKALRSQQQKDRRDADEVTHIMITECQALLRLFGIPYITAPMEAEAQCAELVRLGLVDGIVTDDSDIFLFGGTRVYKNMFNSNKLVECYLSTDLEKEMSLSRDQLIAIAHLLGSDYTEGLPGVGPVTALEILSEFPTDNGLQDFKDWWSSVQLSNVPLTTEKSTFRKKFRRSQSTKLFLPPTFPSAAVTEAYLKPDVDSTPEPFQWGVPDLDRLRDFLMATIGWTQERTDEVLVPVIRDMNRRELEGTQANITRFFEGAVGAGANTSGKRDSGSKRMREAVGKLKAKKSGSGMLDGNSATFAEGAARWAEKEKKKAAKGKGKGKRRAVVEGEDELGAGEQGLDGVEVDADDESGSGGEFQEATVRGKGSGKDAKGKVPAKRKRTKV